MKITNVRVLNNYKVKLTNVKLSGVNSSQSSVFEQGTRTPVIPTVPPPSEEEQRFNIVFEYLIKRYEPGWSAATEELGKAATLTILGISSALNPLSVGGTVEAAFNNIGTGPGWFDPIVHPRKFAPAVRSAYKRLDRARSPQRAANKFIQHNVNGLYVETYKPYGGNAFFGYHPDFDWYPGNSLPTQIHMGFSANHDNCIRRSILKNPYGSFSSLMSNLPGNWRKTPWLTDRYAAETSQFDMYLLLRENTTIRDLLSDYTTGRTADLGVVVAGITDANLNTLYRGVCFAAGTISIVPFNDSGRTGGGYSADRVVVGSPWIRFPEAITYSYWLAVNPNEIAGLCFNYDSLIMFNGNTFPENPQNISSSLPLFPMANIVGVSYGYGNALLSSLDALSEAWGNSMEFIAHLGDIPYGSGKEMRIPFALYKDPTIAGNEDYFSWRLDASVSHWKEKFKSPFDGFAHVHMNSSAAIERTYHQWQAPGFTLWTNIASSGASYADNIPVKWAKTQYDYTYGASGPSADAGVVLGVGRFVQSMFKDDLGLSYANRNDQRRFYGDENPRHWCLDNDKANDLLTTVNDILLGQRKWGITYSNSIWGMGICGTSQLGEVQAICTPDEMTDSNKSAMSALSCFYNSFIDVESDGDIKWKRIDGTFTSFVGNSNGVSWVNDRRFRLFYLYPTMLALNMSIVDYFHDGIGYYNLENKSGWYDKALGNIFTTNMEGFGNVVSNFPYPNRATTTKPPQNFWTGIARTSEFELLYACMKGGVTTGLDSLFFTELYNELVNGEITQVTEPEQHRIFVSGSTGNDQNDGIAAPVKTLYRAMDILDAYSGAMPVTVEIGSGTYEIFDKPLHITNSFSGTTDRLVTIKGASGADVVITSSKQIGVSGITLVDAGDPLYNRFKTSVVGNIYKAQLSDFGLLDVGVFGNIRDTYPIIPAFLSVNTDVFNGRRVGAKDLPTLPEVTFNGTRMTLARFPSIGTGPYSSEISPDSSAFIEQVIEKGSGLSVTTPGSTFGIFTYPSGVCYGIDYSGITRWASRVGPGPTSDIFVQGFWRWDWNDEAYRVNSIDTNTRQITVRSNDSAYGIGKVVSCEASQYVASNPSPKRWFAMNIPEELDTTGEYYISRGLSAGVVDTIYFYPPSGVTAGSKLRVSTARMAGGVLWFAGTPGYSSGNQTQSQTAVNTRDSFSAMMKMYKSDNIIIQGLTFDLCSSSAIEIDQCRNVQVKNCTIKNMRKDGIRILDGKDVLVDGCTIRDVGLKGIILTGGNRQTLTGSGNIVSNCTIKGFGKLSHSNGAAIQMSGVGNTIRRNLIADGNGKAVDYAGNNNLIELNNFSNLGFYTDDMGAVYKYADPSCVNNTIKNNFFNNIGGKMAGGIALDFCEGNHLHNSCAIYFDYSGGGDRIIGNVFYQCGTSLSDVDNAIFIGGTDILIQNNIFIDQTRASTFVKFNENNWNNLWTITEIKHCTFNKNGDPWLERDSITDTADKRYGYTPYSYHETNYGEVSFTEGNLNYAGLYNKVDMRSTTWANNSDATQHISSVLVYNPNTDVVSVNFANIERNLAKNNVCIGTTSGETNVFLEKVYATGNLYGGFTFSGTTFSSINGASGYFSNYSNKNFKLTPSGLAAIQQSLPGFEDIPFENIPVYS
jgi:hypothetical protein